MKVKIFWQNECPNCPPAKKLGKELEVGGVSVGYFNIKDVDGLTEAVLHDIMSTPSIILVDDKDSEVKSWVGQVPKLDEIKKLLK